MSRAGRRWWAAFSSGLLLSGLALSQGALVADADSLPPTIIVADAGGVPMVVDSEISGDTVGLGLQEWQPDGSLSADFAWSSSDGRGGNLWLAHLDTLVVGDQDAMPVTGRPGRLHVDDVTRDANGLLTSLAAEWTVDPPSAAPYQVRGPMTWLLRWRSSVPWSAVAAFIPATSVWAEVGIDATTRMTLVNRTSGPVDSLSVEVVGQRAEDWSVDAASPCLTSLPLAPQQSCDVVLRLHTDRPGHTTPSVVVHWPTWDQVICSFLSVEVAGPPAPPVVEALRTPLGVGLAWLGSTQQIAQVQRSVDAGVTWTTIADTWQGDDLLGRRWTDPAPPPGATYRVRVTDQQLFVGQQGTYPSDWSTAVAPLDGGPRLVVTGMGAIGITAPGTSAVAVDPRVVNPISVAISPDGSSFAVAGTLAADRSQVIARYSATGDQQSAPSVLYPIDGSLPSSLEWSPDGRLLAWNSAMGVISVAPADGRGPVVTGPTMPSLTGWLPDSQVVVAGGSFYDTVTRALVDTGVQGALYVDPSGRTAVASTPEQANQGTTLTEFALDRSTLSLRPTGRTGSTSTLTALSGAPSTVLGWSSDGRSLLMRSGIGSLLASVPVDGSSLLGQPQMLTPATPVSAAQWLVAGPALTPVTVNGSTTAYTVGGGRMVGGTTLRCALDDAAATTCDGTWTIATAARAGRHSLTVTATDPSGQSVSAARTWQNTPVLLTPGLGRSFPTPSTVLPAAKRVLDTRSGLGLPRGKLVGGRTVVLSIPGLPADVSAVTVNLTAVGATVPGSYVTAFPADQPMPGTSSLNVSDPQATANLLTVGVAPGGRLALYTSLGSTDLIVDLQGWYSRSSSSRFTAVSPTRLVDTRSGLGGIVGPIASTASTGSVLALAGPVSSLSPQATGLALTLTAVAPQGAGYLSASSDANRPPTSNLNFAAGRTVANGALLGFRDPSSSSMVFWNGGGKPVSTVADLTGWFGPDGDIFTPVTPRRVLDTRSGVGAPAARVAAGASVTLTLSSLPRTTTAVAVNVTAVTPAGSGWLVAYPADLRQRPTASMLNYSSGRTVAAAALVKIDGLQQLTISNAGGASDIVVDLQGYFAP